MWRHLTYSFLFLFVAALGFGGCSFNNTPKRLMAYLPPPQKQAQPASTGNNVPSQEVQAMLVVLNDTGFEKSAPALRKGTLENLGTQLKADLEKQLPLQLTSVMYPEGLSPQGASDTFIQMAKEQEVPYVLVALLSSSEWEVFDRFPLQGMQQGGGMRSSGLPGYRAENYARLELALIDGQTGQPLVTTDGQAWAALERLVVPLESNVYPVIRRDLTQPPIYPDSEETAYETLRWVSGKGAIDQAVMHLEELWKKPRTA